MTIETLRTKGLILFEVIAGSRAYGLATLHSDTDIKGVFYLPKDEFYAGAYFPQISDEKNDVVFYEVGRFFELLQKSNPTILEMIASPEDCIIYKHPLMDELIVQDFLSQDAVKAFANYAMVQVNKAKGLNKKINNPIDEKRKTLLDFCYVLEQNDAIPLLNWLADKGWKQECCGLAKLNHCKGMYGLYYDSSGQYNGVLAKDDSCEISCSPIPKEDKLEAYLVVNQDSFTQHCKSYREYFEWKSNRNEGRFQANIEQNTGYDAKNMMHTLRLMETAKDILLEGKLQVRRQNREELLKIKKGAYSYEELLTRATAIKSQIDLLLPESTWRKSVDKDLIKSKLLSIRTFLYQ